MKPERWAKVEELFHRAAACEPSECFRLLEEAGRVDPELRREVESLLACQGSAILHLQALREEAFGTMTIAASEAVPGAVIGAYHLLEVIGQGGMGEVWLAEQKQPVRRRVAIKLIKAGMDTREVVRRFESERQALALMDHPAIARVFDAGSTPAGRPYFVMEYVPGRPITEYCDRHKLTVPERLQLFIQVCEGIKHAHQKAIIHRDLKPSNILVMEMDGKAVPRIIDFGVAKAISQRLTENTLVTQIGALLGTPEYMSPEQADLAGEDIDTRSDVYSLGMILYELLVGTGPLNFRNLTFDEMLYKVRTEDAPRPSTKLRSLGTQVAVTAQTRRTEPKALLRQMRGDLDSIVLKALEKERARRYQGPSELADDIKHYLRHEPVKARPASAGYRTWKYVQRHRVGVSFVALFALLLLTSVVVSSWMTLRATRAEEEAQAVNDFLRNDILAQASVDGQLRLHSGKPDPDLKLRDAVDRAAARIKGRFARQPLVEASIRHTIGRTYLDLGLLRQAQQQYERELELRELVSGKENQDLLRAKFFLATTYFEGGRYKDAEELLDEAIKGQRRLLGKEHIQTLSSEQNLAVIYRSEGRYAEAETLNRQLLSIRRRLMGEDSPFTLQIKGNLALDIMAQGRYAEAEPILRELNETMLRKHGPESRDTLNTMGSLAKLYGLENRFEQSEALYAKAVNGLNRLEGKDDRDALLQSEGLAWAYDHEGKYAQSDALFSDVLESERRVLGKDHPQTLAAVADLAASYRRRGMYNKADALLTAEGGSQTASNH